MLCCVLISRDLTDVCAEQREYENKCESPVIFLGGPLTVTDANLALGRLLPSFFPKIFGPGENEPLSLEETMKHFHQLTQEINLFLSSNQSQALDFTEILKTP